MRPPQPLWPWAPAAVSAGPQDRRSRPRTRCGPAKSMGVLPQKSGSLTAKCGLWRPSLSPGLCEAETVGPSRRAVGQTPGQGDAPSRQG